MCNEEKIVKDYTELKVSEMKKMSDEFFKCSNFHLDLNEISLHKYTADFFFEKGSLSCVMNAEDIPFQFFKQEESPCEKIHKHVGCFSLNELRENFMKDGVNVIRVFRKEENIVLFSGLREIKKIPFSQTL